MTSATGPNSPPPEGSSSLLRPLALNAGYLLVIGLAGYGLLLAWQRLTPILLPLVIATLLTALLDPLAQCLHRRLHFPVVLAALTTALLLLGVVAGLFIWILPELFDQSARVVEQLGDGIAQVPSLLEKIGIDNVDMSELADRLSENLGSLGGLVGGGLASVTATATSFVGGIVVTVMLLIYLLAGGRAFFRGLLKLVPEDRRERSGHDAERGWVALTAYVRTQVQVAAIDGVGVGVGLWIIGVPLAVPLAILTFILAFIPYFGAIVAGIIGALVALSTNGVSGFVGAAIVATIVQQVEGNVLYPLLIGHSIRMSPIVVLLAVGVGASLLGIIGAFMATPVVAFTGAALGLVATEHPAHRQP